MDITPGARRCGSAHSQRLILTPLRASPSALHTLPLKLLQLHLQSRELTRQSLSLDFNIIRALGHPKLLRVQGQDVARMLARIVSALLILLLRFQAIETARERFERGLLGAEAGGAVGGEGGEGGGDAGEGVFVRMDVELVLGFADELGKTS